MVAKMDFYAICMASTKLKMSPVFEIVHYALMAVNIKRDLHNLCKYKYFNLTFNLPLTI